MPQRHGRIAQPSASLTALAACVAGLLIGCTPASTPDALRSVRANGHLDTLFDQLRTAPDAEEAGAIEQQIWAVWTRSGDPKVDRLMQKGMAAMAAGKYDSAAVVFDKVVAMAPEFPEGWNKRATVHYLRGDNAASLRDIGRTLALEKRHFGALSGLGTIYVAQGNLRGALRAFEAVLALSPQTRGTRRLVALLRARLGIAEA